MTTRVNVGTVDMGANLVGSLTKNMHFSGTLSLETVKVDGRDVTRVRLTVGDWLGQGVALVTFSNAQMTWYPSAATRDTWGIATATTTASESGSADNDI
jgi:hypothetical protein